MINGDPSDLSRVYPACHPVRAGTGSDTLMTLKWQVVETLDGWMIN